jgi:two-component sensor histidine kinase
MLVERSNIPGRLHYTFRSNLEDDESLPVLVRQDLLRIAQEAISNALRHAKSTAISGKARCHSSAEPGQKTRNEHVIFIEAHQWPFIAFFPEDSQCSLVLDCRSLI